MKIIILISILLAAGLAAAAQTAVKTASPALRGDAALDELKKTGGYDGLRQAVRESRQKDGSTEPPPTADAIGQNSKLTASDGAAGDRFGTSVAVDGNTAVVGAYFESTAPNTTNGAAYVYVRNGTAWSEQAKLTASDAASADLFGKSVAISGNTIVVGAYAAATAPNTTNGAAYVFTRSGSVWAQQAKLLASDPATDDLFGFSVAIDADTIVVSAILEDTTPNTNNGAVYVFTRNGSVWSQQAKLLASDPASNDNFGYSVAIDGDTMVVGTGFENTVPNIDNGAAYICVRSGSVWSQQAKLLASDAASFDQFGTSVAISGETVVVGAFFENTAPNTDNGAAYVFTRSGAVWSQQAKLLASDVSSNDQFGYSVAISGNVIVVGANTEDTAPNTDNGAAYVFARNGAAWSPAAKLLAADPESNAGFGFAVAVSGPNIVAGAFSDDVGANADQGAAYVFRFLGSAWTEEARRAASDGAIRDTLGFSIAINGDTAVVGALGEDTAPNTDNGAAYVFTRSGATWTEQAKLTASDAATSDQFGWSVGISGDTIVVGASAENTAPHTFNGAAYVFTRSAGVWSQQAKLLASDAASNDFFATSVAIDGNTIIVGSPGADSGQGNAGAAYVFTRSGAVWTQQSKLLAPDAAGLDFLGDSVAIWGDTAVVGTDAEDTGPNTDNGAVYVFVRSGAVWSQQAKLLASDPASSDQFGWSIAISGDTIVVGAVGEDTAPNVDNGAAYVFTRSAGVWSQQAKLLASDAASNDDFAKNVGIDGDTIVVGADKGDAAPNDDHGAAYVFTRSGGVWTQQAKLLASDGAGSDRFGWSAAISGDTIVVGAPAADPLSAAPATGIDFAPQALAQGAVYFFVNNVIPTAAEVSVAGRVLTGDGRGVANALVYLTKANGETVTTRTGTFGYYRFDEVEIGQTIVVGVTSKRFQFAPRVVSLDDALADLDLIAQD